MSLLIISEAVLSRCWLSVADSEPATRMDSDSGKTLTARPASLWVGSWEEGRMMCVNGALLRDNSGRLSILSPGSAQPHNNPTPLNTRPQMLAYYLNGGYLLNFMLKTVRCNGWVTLRNQSSEIWLRSYEVTISSPVVNTERLTWIYSGIRCE